MAAEACFQARLPSNFIMSLSLSGPLITAANAATQRAMTSELPGDIELRVEQGLVPYRAALDEMTARNLAISEGTERELIWLLEHPPVYTAGTSAAAPELLDPRFE